MNAERPPDFPIRLLVDLDGLAQSLSVSKRTVQRLQKAGVIHPQLSAGSVKRYCPFTAARQVAKAAGQQYTPPTISIHIANP